MKVLNCFSTNPRFISYARLAIPSLVCSLAVILSGCKTVNTTGASNFATSVSTVKIQADDALNAATVLTRNAGITYVSTLPTLNESEFSETPTADTVAAWDNTLAALESYALNLAALTSPNSAGSFDVAATNLFNQCAETARDLNSNALSSSPTVNAGLAAGFTELGTLIIEAKAEAKARKIASATDPKISEILNLMANEIGEDHVSPCLRTTIYREWNTEAGNLVSGFLAAKASQTTKASIAQQYATILNERDAQDASLLALRRSLLALADAHHALAQGNTTSIQSTLAIVLNDLQQTQNLYNQFSSDLKK